ncbi:unnamed protein product [Schistocephalus solidus]|uniref:FMRFamide receptor n=1 Tax=Schistocephalus solidus TaxID=70667 RepID=A0A0V0JBK0_SCHSO|nr:unnamed protein product [Schistocephalus solidus]
METHFSQNNSTSIYQRYPGGHLLKRFVPDAYYLKLYASPAWFFVGLIGNAISFLIWVSYKQRGKNSSAIYLAALALSDFFLILLLFSDYMRRFLFFESPITVNGLCQLFQGVFLFLQYYSIALTFGFTLERWIAICYPFKRHKLCSSRRALIGVSALALIVISFNVFYAAAWEIVDGECVLASRWQDDSSFYIYLSTVECVFSLLVPLATLVFNVLVLREIGKLVRSKIVVKSRNSSLLRQRDSRSSVHVPDQQLILGSKHSGHSASTKEQSNFHAATLMLVILSFYLILCTLPVGIVFVVQMRFISFSEYLTDEEVLRNPQWGEYFGFLRAKEIVDFLCSSHYACNFIIYLITGKSFRSQLLDTVACRQKKLRTEMTSGIATNQPICNQSRGRMIRQTANKLELRDPANRKKQSVLVNQENKDWLEVPG